MARVDVVIPNWNGERYLPACLQALAEQTFSDRDVTVVDNGSTDHSLDVVREREPSAHIIRSLENRGFAGAVNMGIGRATTEYVALLNTDTRPEPRWLESLVRALDETPAASFAASKLILDGVDTIDAAGDGYSLVRVAGVRIGEGEPRSSHSERAWVFGASAAAALYRRSLFEDIGTFDEDFFLLHEDIDLDMRAQLAGHRCLYVPDAIVYHVRGGSTDTLAPTTRALDCRNRLWVVGKNLPLPLVAIAMVFYIPRVVVAAIARGGVTTYASQIWDGVRRLPAKRRAARSQRVGTIAASAVIFRRPEPVRQG